MEFNKYLVKCVIIVVKNKVDLYKFKMWNKKQNLFIPYLRRKINFLNDFIH